MATRSEVISNKKTIPTRGFSGASSIKTMELWPAIKFGLLLALMNILIILCVVIVAGWADSLVDNKIIVSILGALTAVGLYAMYYDYMTK